MGVTVAIVQVTNVYVFVGLFIIKFTFIILQASRLLELYSLDCLLGQSILLLVLRALLT
jgi:hypothetical protein